MKRQSIYTIGHSTHEIEDFMAMLDSFGIEMLADVRTIPKSRHNPQFAQSPLSRALKKKKIGYLWMKELGGLRRALKDSPNGGWRNSSFRGYADYMQTKEFACALSQLVTLSKKMRVSIMCAEALPWRCHRSLIADALVIRHIPVLHIMLKGKSQPHELTRFAQVKDKIILYPPEEPELALHAPRAG